MKAKTFLILVILFPTLLISCKFLEKRTLFSKDVDTLLDYTIEEPEEDTSMIVEVEEELPPVEEISTPEPTMAASAEQDKYFIIVGCFLNYQYAEGYSDKIAAMGYNTQVIARYDGFNLVAAKSYSSFREAVNELPTFRSSVQSNAWVWVKR